MDEGEAAGPFVAVTPRIDLALDGSRTPTASRGHPGSPIRSGTTVGDGGRAAACVVARERDLAIGVCLVTRNPAPESLRTGYRPAQLPSLMGGAREGPRNGTRVRCCSSQSSP